jgi:hypothetical protein
LWQKKGDVEAREEKTEMNGGRKEGENGITVVVL